MVWADDEVHRSGGGRIGGGIHRGARRLRGVHGRSAPYDRPREPAATIFEVLAIAGAVIGFVAGAIRSARREPSGDSNVAEADTAPRAWRVGSAVRMILLILGAIGQLTFIRDESVGGFTWLAVGGLAAVLLGMPLATRAEGRRAIVSLAFVIVVPMLVLLPMFGLGLILGPAALSLCLAALVPTSGPPDWTGRDVARVVTIVLAVLVGAVLVVIVSLPRAVSG